MMVMAGDNVILVQRTLQHAGDKSFPDPRAVLTNRKRMGVIVPRVEVSDHRDPGRVRRPYREECAFCALNRHEMGTELLVEAEMVPFLKQVDVVVREKADAVDHTVLFFNAFSFHAEPLRHVATEKPNSSQHG